MIPTATLNQEKRQFFRIPVELDVNLHLLQDGRPVTVDVTLKDLSLGGLGIQASRLLDLQPEQPVEVAAASCAGVEATVQWVDNSGYGLSISQRPDRVARTWVGHILELQGVDLDTLNLN